MFSLNGKIGLVTGGATGIGAGIAKAFLQSKLKAVSIVDINETAGLQLVEELNTKCGKGKAIFIKADISQKDQFEYAFKETINCFKNLDIVVNNAGVVKETDWEKEIAINLTGTITGTILAVEHYLPTYKSGNEGVVVNIASLAGLFAQPATPVYCAAKSAVIGLSQSLGHKIHYKRTKIKVLAICPGYTDTTILNINDDTLLGPSYRKSYDKSLELYKKQPVAIVADEVVKILKEGNSGSIWVVENNKPAYEVKLLCNRINDTQHKKHKM